MKTRAVIALLFALVAATSAHAQPVTSIGPVTPGDCSMYNSPTVIKDAGFPCPSGGAGFVVGPGTSAVGDVPLFDNTTGNGISDSGISGVYKQPTSYPSNITSGHFFCAADSDCQFGNAWSQYPLGSVSTNPIIIGKAGSSIGSSTLGQTFKIVFTSTGLSGSPITITYTAVGGDTVSTIATNLCALVNANTTLHNTFGQPIFCQATSGGIFNLQYIASFSATGATPLTTATTGSTGTITLASETNALDYEILPLGRNVSGRNAAVGDGIYAIDFTGQDASGNYTIHYGQITVDIATPGTRGQMTFLTAAGAEFALNEGLALYDSTGTIATGGTLGFGTINLPNTGGLYIGNNAVALNGALYGVNVFGGAAAASSLNLQSTQSGSPSGDFVEITTGGSVRQKWFSDGGSTMGTPTGGDLGAGKLNVAGGLYVNNVAALVSGGALGTPSSATLTNATGLPISGVTGLGTGVGAALGDAVNTTGGFPTYTASTWTPTITTSATVGTPAYSIQVGSYEQIGRQVTARFSITLSGWTGSPTGNVSVGGLPVAAASTTNDYGGCIITNYTVSALGSSTQGVTGYISPGASSANLVSNGVSGSLAITAAEFGTTATVFGTCHYHT
jgi:hypothetical protein